MAKKPIKLMCAVAVLGSFLLANYASQHFGLLWSITSITLAGAVSLAAVVTYILTAQS